MRNNNFFMNDDEKQRRKQFCQWSGYMAAKDGHSLKDNPFDEITEPQQFIWWKAGWVEGNFNEGNFMKVIHLGDDVELDCEALDFVVTDYSFYGYDGSGVAIGVKDEKLYECGLSHCSCYGPGEDGFNEISMETFLAKPKTIFNSEYSEEMKKLILEFINR